jgi:hypothetical protein
MLREAVNGPPLCLEAPLARFRAQVPVSTRAACISDRVAAARELVRNGTAIDVALLDINLGGGSAMPLLEALATKRRADEEVFWS